MNEKDVKNEQVKKVDELLVKQRQELLDMLNEINKNDAHDTRLTNIVADAYTDMGRSVDDVRRCSKRMDRVSYANYLD